MPGVYRDRDGDQPYGRSAESSACEDPPRPLWAAGGRGPEMGRAAVDQLLYLMDEAFKGADEEDLLGNIRSVTQAEWVAVLPGCARSIRQIVGHVGACKYMYDNHAFGDGTMTWEDPAGELEASMEDLQSGTLDPEPAIEAVIEWLRKGHR